MPLNLYDVKPILAFVKSVEISQAHRRSIQRFQDWLVNQNKLTIDAQTFLEYAGVRKSTDLLYTLKCALETEIGKETAILQPLKIAIVDQRRRSNKLKLVTEMVKSPWWRPFLGEEKVHNLTASEIDRFDSFLSWLNTNKISSLSEYDYLRFAEGNRSIGPLEGLLVTFRKLGVPKIAEIEIALSAAIVTKRYECSAYTAHPRTHWDRALSVTLDELPETWRSTLSSLKCEDDQRINHAIPASVLKVTEETARSYVFFCRRNGFSTSYNVETIVGYVRHLKQRSVKASTRAISLRSLRRLYSYLPGENVDEVFFRRFIAEQVRETKYEVDKNFINDNVIKLNIKTENIECEDVQIELKEKIKKPESFDEVLSQAVKLLKTSHAASTHAKRMACLKDAIALALFTLVPLRSSDTNIALGTHITYTGKRYRIDIETSKTGQGIHTELCNFLTPFLDALVLQGCDVRLLHQQRKAAIERKLSLFCHGNKRSYSKQRVANIWRKLFRCGPHLARKLLHDELGRLGPKGLEMALLLCAQKDPKTAEFYRGKAAYDARMLLTQAVLVEDFTDEQLAQFAPDLDLPSPQVWPKFNKL